VIRPLETKRLWRRGGGGSLRGQWRAALACFTGALMVFAPLRLSYPAPAHPDQPDLVKDFVKRLESSYHSVKTLRAKFVQTYVADGRTRVESGTVIFARGGRMRWDYRQPEKKVFVADGKFLLLYVPEENQMTRSRVKESDDARVPFRLLLSRLNLGRVFGRIEFADQALKPEPGDRVLRAIPKHAEESGYHEVLMEITPTFDIHRLIIHFTDQSSMDFTFDGIERNVHLSYSLFDFTPPKGTEVIDQPGE
jgi:outer membrane lipoprotein carrier protein